MFPIRDHNPAARPPVVTYVLIAVNVGVFLWGQTLSEPASLMALYDRWAVVPQAIVDGADLVTLGSALFLHGGWLHLAGNMLFLYIFGDNLEDSLGHAGFALFYLLAGAGAMLAQVLADPASTVPVIGASGAIAGVMGGYLLLFPKARIDILFFFVVIVRIVPVPAWAMLGIWFGFQVVNGLRMPTDMGGVAYWAHIGGFLLGVLLILPVWWAKGGVRFWARTHGHPDHPRARVHDRRPSARSAGPWARPESAPAPDLPLSPTQVPQVPRRR